MSEIRRRDLDAEEIARIGEVVGRHPLPDFVTGFEVRLGEFDGDRAFTTLQEARHAADYDLAVPFESAYGFELMELAEAAHWMLDQLRGGAGIGDLHGRPSP